MYSDTVEAPPVTDRIRAIQQYDGPGQQQMPGRTFPPSPPARRLASIAMCGLLLDGPVSSRNQFELGPKTFCKLGSRGSQPGHHDVEWYGAYRID